MKHLGICALAGALVLLSALRAEANALADPGFEDPNLYTFDGAPFIGSWEGFSAGGNAGSGHDTTDPFMGTGHANVNILGDDNSFAGVFQDVTVFPGADVTASLWHKTPDSSATFGVGTEFRLEWRDSNGDELSRVTNDGVIPTNEYSLVSFNGIAPAGSVTARFVYAVQTFGGEPNPNNFGTVFLDNASVTIVPEPTAVMLALIGLAPLSGRRR